MNGRRRRVLAGVLGVVAAIILLFGTFVSPWFQVLLTSSIFDSKSYTLFELSSLHGVGGFSNAAWAVMLLGALLLAGGGTIYLASQEVAWSIAGIASMFLGAAAAGVALVKAGLPSATALHVQLTAWRSGPTLCFLGCVLGVVAAGAGTVDQFRAGSLESPHGTRRADGTSQAISEITRIGFKER